MFIDTEQTKTNPYTQPAKWVDCARLPWQRVSAFPVCRQLELNSNSRNGPLYYSHSLVWFRRENSHNNMYRHSQLEDSCSLQQVT